MATKFIYPTRLYTRILLKAVKRGNYNVEQVDKLQDTVYWYQSGRLKKIKHEI